MGLVESERSETAQELLKCLNRKASELKEDLYEISKYDPELRFRQVTGITWRRIFYMTLILSLFHIYTAGFGVLQQWRHRAFHLAFVLPLVFFLYSIRKESITERKHFYYDIFYAVIAAMLSATMFRELPAQSTSISLIWGAASFVLVFYLSGVFSGVAALCMLLHEKQNLDRRAGYHVCHLHDSAQPT